MTSPASTVSPQLDRALTALRGEVLDTDNPVGAARAVRRVAARCRRAILPEDDQSGGLIRVRPIP